MKINFKIILLFLPLLLTAFSQGDRTDNFEKPVKLEYYSNFQILKESSEPREMKVFITSNIGKGKSLIESGILITYKNRYAKEVSIAGDFSDWESLDMTRSRNGVWYYFLTKISKNKTTKYKFMVDGIWIIDPMNLEKEDDDSGSYVSLIEPLNFTETHNLTYRFIGRHMVEFRIYKPVAKYVSIVGDFNNWNPENDLLNKNDNGIWSLRKRLAPGIYRYKYFIDGDSTVDLFNQKTAGDSAGDICSLINVVK